MDNQTTAQTPKFDLGALRHVARVPTNTGANHLAPKTLEDLNAELNSLDMGHMEFVKYEGKEDPHLEAFLADEGGSGDSGA